MVDDAIHFIESVTGASQARIGEQLQSLWSGYGSICRVYLNLHERETAILKRIEPPANPGHPRGWNTAVSHQRKLKSYDVEANWYKHFAHQCTHDCVVPMSLGVGSTTSSQFILMQDLDCDYPLRCASLSVEECLVCLQWLANFHARFLHEPGSGLWPIGTYWHLSTRLDEFQRMDDSQIKQSAQRLDHALNHCRFQTLVHGDAKVANFCFSLDKQSVAAVDFQYVGRGCGIKDVVYFLGSCLSETACETHEEMLLNAYFTALSTALTSSHASSHASQDIDALEHEWRALYAIAWTDFYRFLLGWMPTHKKINRYTEKLAARALGRLDSFDCEC